MRWNANLSNIQSVRLKGVRLSIRQKRSKARGGVLINMLLQINYLLKIRLIQYNLKTLKKTKNKTCSDIDVKVTYMTRKICNEIYIYQIYQVLDWMVLDFQYDRSVLGSRRCFVLIRLYKVIICSK